MLRMKHHSDHMLVNTPSFFSQTFKNNLKGTELLDKAAVENVRDPLGIKKKLDFMFSRETVSTDVYMFWG